MISPVPSKPAAVSGVLVSVADCMIARAAASSKLFECVGATLRTWCLLARKDTSPMKHATCSSVASPPFPPAPFPEYRRWSKPSGLRHDWRCSDSHIVRGHLPHHRKWKRLMKHLWTWIEIGISGKQYELYCCMDWNTTVLESPEMCDYQYMALPHHCDVSKGYQAYFDTSKKPRNSIVDVICMNHSYIILLVTRDIKTKLAAVAIA